MVDILLPTSEKVVVAWLQSVPELSGYGIATTLAAQTSWSPRTDGFIQVAVSPLGAAPHVNFPAHRPRVIISCWAQPQKWVRADQLAAIVWKASYEAFDQVINIAPIKNKGQIVATYAPARLMAVQALGDPIRIPGEAAESLARYDVPLAVEWINE